MSLMQGHDKSSIEAAQEAIAKVNAMLIAKGKLKPSQLGGSGSKKLGAQGHIITKEVEINDVPIGCRNMLTRGATQEEISKMSSAAVATKGRYMTHEERARNPKERPLYLSVQATSQDAVNLAVGKINEIIANGLARQGPRLSRFSPQGGPRGVNPGGHRMSGPPQPLMGNQNIQLLQEKLYIGLEHAPPNFSVKDKILGVGGSFLQHIQGETGAKVTLRGKGSGFIEPTGGEALEPMHVFLQHVSKLGLQQAKELATNLIQTVQQEYAQFQQSFVNIPPPNMLQQPQQMMLPPPPHVVSLAQPPPLLPGQQIMTSVPPPTLMQPPPLQAPLMPPPMQGNVSVSLPAPGIVIPQLASSTTQPPPGQIIQQAPPVQTFSQPPNIPGQHFQLVQSSDIGGQMGGQQQVFVSSAGQQPGQMVLTTMGGQQIPQPLPQPMQPQFGPPGTIQLQQPLPSQPGALPAAPQQIIQQPTIQQQQPGIPQQVTLQQQQQTVMQQPPPQQFIQQPMLQTSLQQVPQQVPPGSVTVIQQPAPVSLPQPAPEQVQQPGQQLQHTVGWSQPAGSFVTVQSGAPPVPVQHQPLQHQQQPGSVVYSVQQTNQAPDMIMSSPQTSVVMTSSSANPVTSAPSNYVYKTGPLEEPRRRFTEEKQEDKLPEGLLGYEHGPPHLTNLMVQPGQQAPAVALGNQNLPDPTQQPQQPVYAGQVIQQVQGQAPQQVDLQGQPPQQIVYTQQPGGQPQQLIVAQQPSLQQQQQQQFGLISQQQSLPQQQQQAQILQQQQQLQQPTMQQPLSEQPRPEGEIGVPEHSSSPAPVQGYIPGGSTEQPGQGYIPSGSAEQPLGFTAGTSSEDQVLMPPPPPPLVGIKRQSPSLSPQSVPEPRKKTKGFHSDDDDDRDIPSSMSSQIKELKKYSFNQYSSTPQLYNSTSQVSTFSQYGSPQNGSHPGTQGPGDYPTFQQDQQQQQQQMGQFQQQDGQNRGQQGFMNTSSPQLSVYNQSSSGQNFPVYNMAQSPAYSTVTSSPQQMTFTSQPPPPPPPGFEETRSRSPAGHGPSGSGDDKTRGFSPKFIPMGPRDELLNQPPPPPPPARYW